MKCRHYGLETSYDRNSGLDLHLGIHPQVPDQTIRPINEANLHSYWCYGIHCGFSAAVEGGEPISVAEAQRMASERIAAWYKTKSELFGGGSKVME